MSNRLRELIDDGRVHVVDGAMGTMLYDRGVFVNVCYDELNLTRPAVVRDVHARYIKAGAEILETNTFGANPVKLSAYGLDEQTEAINRRAVELARTAANGRACVVGTIGPLGVRMEPFGPTACDEAVELFTRQARGLLEGGVDGFILETFSDVDELRAAFRAVRRLSDLPVIGQMTVGDDGRTIYGTDVETIALALAGEGIDVIGLNCSVGPAVMLDAIERMAAVTDRPLAAQPNAGLPRAVGNRRMYLSSPEYMANYAERLVAAGVRFVGGCCGTTADHIRAIRAQVASVSPGPPGPPGRVGGYAAGAAPIAVSPTAVPLAERSSWGARIAAGEFVVSVELLPPAGCQPDRLIEQARAAKAAGAHAVSVPDGARALGRMSAIASAIVIQREADIETVVHFTCRDRNMIGMVGDLLGAAAAGVRNLLIVTGDPAGLGTYPDATPVFDIDSIGLTNVVHRLNQGLDPGGHAIGAPTRFVIGVAVNPWAADLEQELKRFYWKVEAGAEFAVTQPVFDVRGLETFLERTRPHRIPIVATIWPFVSARHAEFLANEVPGVHVPASVQTRMRRAQEQGDSAARAEGVAIAREMRDAVKGLVQGVHIVTSFGRIETAVDVMV